MGKRELNRQKRRATIVEVATRSFLEQGYAATSMSAIADELGGSKATLWGHFASKEELFSAVVDEQVARFAAEMEGATTDEVFSVAALHSYCLRFLRTLMRPQSISLFRLIMGEGGRFPELNAVFHVRGPAKVLNYLTDFMATGLPRSEAQRVALLTISALVGWRSQMLTRPEPVAPEEAEQFVDDFIAHLKLSRYEDAPEQPQS
ncbi:TetR/AcrR family transcriptional regulator [Novosphingobium sp. M1R2S20]|uniref:TetR/AcrR family transcriptional regulator n=1 Tax=Novosphingobium rhizovicinum TaxID=3228928 RepID=A0ABV3R858_9SPHN